MKPIVISISGKSGVGKTTIANLIRYCLGTDKSILFSTDDLHKYARGHSAWDTITHFHPEANNIELGDFHISQLIDDKAIYRSTYNHHTGEFDAPTLITPKPFVINEGLHAFYSDEMKRMSDFKIYVDTDDELTKSWKIARDTKYRGKTKDEVLRSMNRRSIDAHFIENQREYADLILKFIEIDGAVKLIVDKKSSKHYLFDNILDQLLNYFNDISSLVILSKGVGSSDLVQGPAGNVSVKSDSHMLIKASGTCLPDVDYFAGWCNLDIEYFLDYTSFVKALDEQKYFDILNASVQDNGTPSMESGMHSILKKYVIHTHPDSLMPILCSKTFEQTIKSLYSEYDYCIVPAMKPGLALFEYIQSQDRIHDVYFLQNHGIIVTSDSEEVMDLHAEIVERAKNLKYDRSARNEGYITPDEYVFRNCTDSWYTSMKEYYDRIKQMPNVNILSDTVLQEIDNLEFEQRRKAK
tara:strand:+ start:855 stop:2255 length:1401 start_codon:yes stop_codon:yes gene_type:complete